MGKLAKAIFKTTDTCWFRWNWQGWQTFSRFSNLHKLHSSLGANQCNFKSRDDLYALQTILCWYIVGPIESTSGKVCAVTKLLQVKLELIRFKATTLKYKIRWRKVESRKCLKGCTSCILINPVQNFMMWWQKVRGRLIWAQEIFEAHGWSNSKSG